MSPAVDPAHDDEESTAPAAPQPEIDGLSLVYPPELPISARAEDIRRTLTQHQVVIVAGATGSGKTTQLPKLALEAYAASRGEMDAPARAPIASGSSNHRTTKRQPLIGITQPRRIAATSTAARVAEETGSTLGSAVGYQIRFENRTGPETRLKFMTDGILLAEIQADPLLRRYHTLIIDEAHERGLTIDFLLGWLKGILPKRPDLKLVISSATIETERFSQFFDGAPVITVEGRTFPVDVLYEPPDPELDLSEAVADAVESLANLDSRGDFLVFLPGEREILETERALGVKKLRHTEILPLYARLSAADQNKVFASRSLRRIILATNVAETSLTIPGIVYVVDTGVARLSRYDARTGITRLHIEQVSQASADQRKGRAGRVRDGICVRLYDETNFATRPAYTDPEVLRVGLDGVILRMKALGLGDVETFPFIDPPRPGAITEGYRILTELGALDEERNLTAVGHQLAKFPVDPRVARMILQGARFGVLPEVLVLAAALEVQDVRERPRGEEHKADRAHQRFRNETSDFSSMLQLWKFLEESASTSKGQLRRICKDHYLSHRRVREWREVHRQLTSAVRDLQLEGRGDPGSRSRTRRPRDQGPQEMSANAEHLDYSAKLHCALLSGLLSRVGQYNAERRVYFGARQTRFVIHPSSSLAKKPPPWVMAFELVETSQLFARAVAKLEPEWFTYVANHLLKRSYSEPHWSEKSARAVIKEHATLYGLPVLKDRTVDYSSVAPGRARLLFLEHALVRGEYETRAPFFIANQALLAEVSQLRDKARRSDMLSDEEALLTFFDQRVPSDVVDGKTFENWRKEAEKSDPKRLHLRLSDVLLEEEHLDPKDYPDTLEVVGAALPLTYKFEPTADDDGITVDVPLAWVPRLDPELFDWTIPAWQRLKVSELLLRLPKASLRRLSSGPGGDLTDLSERLLVHLRPFTEPFLPALERALLRETGFAPSTGELRPDLLPGYLRFYCRIIGEGGKVLDAGRDFRALFERHGATARSVLSEARSASAWRRTGVTTWDFEDIPESVTDVVMGSAVELYPALVDQRAHIDLTLLPSLEEANAASRRGALRLAILSLDKVATSLQKSIPKNVEPLSLRVGPLGPTTPQREEFRRQLVERALVEALGASARDQPWPRSKREFERWLENAAPGWEKQLSALMQLVAAVAPELKQTRAALTDAGKQPSGAAALRDMGEQLAQLFPDDLLSTTHVAQLVHFPRYLKGMRLRLSRALSDPRKDMDKAAQFTPLWLSFAKRRAELPWEQAVTLRWALEELRIAVFAPELKTAFSVSPAKLKIALEG